MKGHFVVVGLGECGGRPCDGMELISGSNVTQPMTREQALDLEEEIRAVIFAHFDQKSRVTYWRRLDVKARYFPALMRGPR